MFGHGLPAADVVFPSVISPETMWLPWFTCVVPGGPGARSRQHDRLSPVRHGWRETGQHDHRALRTTEVSSRQQQDSSDVVVMTCQGSRWAGAVVGTAMGLGRESPVILMQQQSTGCLPEASRPSFSPGGPRLIGWGAGQKYL